MAKKSSNGSNNKGSRYVGIESVGDAEKPTTESKAVGRPKTSFDEERATFKVKKVLLQKLRNYAYWNRMEIKTVVNDALEELLARVEKKTPELLKNKPRVK